MFHFEKIYCNLHIVSLFDYLICEVVDVVSALRLSSSNKFACVRLWTELGYQIERNMIECMCGDIEVCDPKCITSSN